MAVIQIPPASELLDKIDEILAYAEPEELWYIYLYMKSFEKKGKRNEPGGNTGEPCKQARHFDRQRT